MQNLVEQDSLQGIDDSTDIELSVNVTGSPHSRALSWSEGKWKDLHKVTERIEYSACRFQDGKRNNVSAIGISMIVLDFDEGVTLEEGIEMFSSCKSLIVTTKSHQVDKHGLVADRFRVLLPLNYCIIDMEYYSMVMKKIIRFYNADAACSDAARYFAPCPKNQLVFYSDSEEIFDITMFDVMIQTDEVEQKHITRPSKKVQEQQITSLQPHRVDLSSLLDEKITYYRYGLKTVDTLEEIINKTEVSDTAIRCHCFLNKAHEDKKPSCYIYHNWNNIYAKCSSCQIEGIIYF